MIAEEKGTCLVPATPVQAVDTTGAGDAFIGSLAVYLSQGSALREAVGKANAVAALSVTRPGTQTSFPRLDEVIVDHQELGGGDAKFRGPNQEYLRIGFAALRVLHRDGGLEELPGIGQAHDQLDVAARRARTNGLQDTGLMQAF